MNRPVFISLYRNTISGKRVLFVFRRRSRRLPDSEPVVLVCQAVFDPYSFEYQTFVFDSNWKDESLRMMHTFMNSFSNPADYNKVCKWSLTNFCEFLASCGVEAKDFPSDVLLF